MRKNSFKKCLVLVAIALVGLFLLSGCSGEKGNESGDGAGLVDEAATDKQVYEFNFATETPDGHPISERAIDGWVKKIEEATDGRVHFTVHYAGSLVEGGSMLQGVSSGIADVGWCPFSYFAGELPVYNALCVGGYEWLNSKIGSYVNMDFMKAFPEELPDKLEFMFTHSTIPAALMTNKPIATKEDLKGLQIRCDTVHMDGVAALGAKPVSMTMPEAYEGLSKNIIDGVLGPTEVLIGWNLYETTKYITEAPLLYNAIPVVMFNKKAWNSLPEDIQDIIKKINDKHLEDVSTLYDEVHLEALEFGLENGLEVVKVSEEENERWKEALEPCKETYAENLNNRGLPGNEAMDKIGELVAKYKEEFAEYDESFRKEIESLIKKHQ